VVVTALMVRILQEPRAVLAVVAALAVREIQAVQGERHLVLHHWVIREILGTLEQMELLEPLELLEILEVQVLLGRGV
jgi:hypothetical protein